MAETRFHSLLKAKINERINELSTELSAGMAKDYANYQGYVRHIQGLSECLRLCEDVEAEFDN